MKWVNPPVAYMLHAGVPLLVGAGVHLPAVMHRAGDPQRVALEGYPGLLAREVLGRRPYKSDDRARQTPERQTARARLVAALEPAARGWACGWRSTPRSATRSSPSRAATGSTRCCA